MIVTKTVLEVRNALKNNVSLGFVPTMGALHNGHLSLVNACKNRCEQTVVSLFVNPTQFNSAEDLKKYPTKIEEDLKKLDAWGVDVVFLPTFAEVYPDGFTYEVSEKNFSKKFCGANRPGHFQGVLTVVMKLFNIVKPNYAFFGEKDFQQLKLIQGMVDAFFMDLKIISVPTLREEDGLAMSSRNLRLGVEAREKAPEFFKALKYSKSSKDAISVLWDQGFDVDYIEDFEGRRFGAVSIDGVRLIDNVEL